MSVKYMQLLAIQPLPIYGIVAKRPCCELVPCFAGLLYNQELKR